MHQPDGQRQGGTGDAPPDGPATSLPSEASSSVDGATVFPVVPGCFATGAAGTTGDTREAVTTMRVAAL